MMKLQFRCAKCQALVETPLIAHLKALEVTIHEGYGQITMCCDTCFVKNAELVATTSDGPMQ